MQAFGPVLFTNWNLEGIINKYILNDDSYFKHDTLNVIKIKCISHTILFLVNVLLNVLLNCHMMICPLNKLCTIFIYITK